jgi:hypothetical protein
MKRSILHTALATIAILSACMEHGLTALFWTSAQESQTHLDGAIA